MCINQRLTKLFHSGISIADHVAEMHQRWCCLAEEPFGLVKCFQ